jgi:dienelactone hydrolase
MRWALALCMLVALVGTAGAQQVPGPVGTPEGPWREQIYWVPLNADGVQRLLYARVCRPPGETAARVVVLAHGTPAEVSERGTMKPYACNSEPVRWFLDRGFVVVSSLRRGYGATGGAADDFMPNCAQAVRDYARIGLISAADVAATVDYAATLPFARPTGIIVVGQSSGGLGVIAYDSLPHPRVSAIVNFAGGHGGHGGHFGQKPNNNCQPERLPVAAGTLARTATTPMLWIYTANDSFFAPPIAKAMYDAYAQAGGRAEFYQLPAFVGEDGHHLFVGRGGSAIWGPLMERYLASRPAQ